MREAIKLIINYEGNDEAEDVAQAVATLQRIQRQLDDAITILQAQDPGQDVNLPTSPTPLITQRYQAENDQGREEHIIMVPLPWEIRGQTRVQVEIVNTSLQFRLIRRRR